jgi:hypothetical protein
VVAEAALTEALAPEALATEVAAAAAEVATAEMAAAAAVAKRRCGGGRNDRGGDGAKAYSTKMVIRLNMASSSVSDDAR